MGSSDFRQNARQKLHGNWGKTVVITLVYFFITFVFNTISKILPSYFSLIWSVFLLVITAPLSFGLLMSYFKVFSGEQVGCFDFFKFAYDNFAKCWLIYFRTLLKLLVPFVLTCLSALLIALGLISSAAYLTASIYATSDISVQPFLILSLIGVIAYTICMIWLITKSYYYFLAQIIVVDNPEVSDKDAVDMSKKLMDGNRGKLFALQLSFIGWILLASLSFGIGFLWLLPYIHFAHFAFYKYVSRSSEE